MGEYASLDTTRSQQPRSPTVAKDSPRFSKAAEVSAAHQSSISGSGVKFAIIPFWLKVAAQIGFTLRRWWRERTEPAVLRVEVERRLVGAPPAIAVLTVTIPQSPSVRHAGPASAASPARSRPT